MHRYFDEIDEDIAKRTERNPDFPELMAEAARRRQLLRTLTEARVAEGLSQTAVAARMGSSQSVVARIEGGNRDVRLSTLMRYAKAVGREIDWAVRERRVS
ncbi:MAG TPA: helix-turn-helix transcriptional regulator [Acidimicrobiales bacterium]|nr:helix-turn-helix transcriptional regulator [Acidimicrobiales bacterium]